MTTMRSVIARHPVLAYFALTFAISWGGILLVIGGPAGIPATTAQDDVRFVFVYLAMLAGPSMASLLMTGLLSGRAGLRNLFARLLGWHVGARWYAIAMLAAPVAAAVVFLALSPISRDFVPGIFVTSEKWTLLFFGLAVALGAGVFEELGWTGFAIPELRRHHGVLATGLIVGVLWGAWHMLAVIWGIGDRAGTIPLAVFVSLDTLTFLPAFRVLMVWVFDRTENLLVGMLMHVSLTATAVVLGPAVRGGALLTYDVAFAAAVWVAVGAIAAASSGRLSPQWRVRRLA